MFSVSYFSNLDFCTLVATVFSFLSNSLAICDESIKILDSINSNVISIVGGEAQNFTYGNCQKEMDVVNRAFIEVMIEGDENGRGFQYPIPTYSITKTFDWTNAKRNKPLFEMAAKYGIPYFSN